MCTNSIGSLQGHGGGVPFTFFKMFLSGVFLSGSLSPAEWYHAATCLGRFWLSVASVVRGGCLPIFVPAAGPFLFWPSSSLVLDAAFFVF